MRRTTILLLSLVCCLVAAASARAASPTQLYDDCQDNGRIDGSYSQADYQRALSDLPSDLDEYTDCRDVIRRAQLAAASGGGNGGGAGAGGSGATGGGGGAGGGSTGSGGGAGAGTTAAGTTGSLAAPAAPVSAEAARNPLSTATPSERQAFQDAVKAGAGPVNVAGQVIKPGTAGIRRLGGDGHQLPAPVLLLLALAAAGLVVFGSSLTWSRVRARGAR